jgi:hypothetical protein
MPLYHDFHVDAIEVRIPTFTAEAALYNTTHSYSNIIAQNNPNLPAISGDTITLNPMIVRDQCQWCLQTCANSIWYNQCNVICGEVCHPFRQPPCSKCLRDCRAAGGDDFECECVECTWACPYIPGLCG